MTKFLFALVALFTFSITTAHAEDSKPAADKQPKKIPIKMTVVASYQIEEGKPMPSAKEILDKYLAEQQRKPAKNR